MNDKQSLQYSWSQNKNQIVINLFCSHHIEYQVAVVSDVEDNNTNGTILCFKLHNTILFKFPIVDTLEYELYKVYNGYDIIVNKKRQMLWSLKPSSSLLSEDTIVNIFEENKTWTYDDCTIKVFDNTTQLT